MNNFWRTGSGTPRIYCIMKRVLSLLLCLLLPLMGCDQARAVAGSYARIDDGWRSAHGHTAFSDMVLSYPDPDEVMQALDAALEQAAEGGDERTLAEVYERELRAYNQLVSAVSLAYVRHCQDVTDEDRAKEYGRLNGALYAIQHGLNRLEKALMDRWGYHLERGAAYAESLERSSRQNGERLLRLREKEDDLCRRYERLDAEYRLDFRGRTWTVEELAADESLSLQEFLAALDLYQLGKNRAAGELFLELMAVRRQLADEGGYPSYGAGQYAAFGRNYTTEQALKAAETVKAVFVPLYARLRERCENDLRYLGGASFREDEFIAAMSEAAERVVSGAGEAWWYMLAYGLYDSRPSERKLKGSFTTYFAAYRCPFLFTQWTDDASSAFTMIHEFGHFLSYYLNPEGTYYGAENLDLAETDAQGFELLMLAEYDALFGRYAAAARLCCLVNALYAVLSGFMEDEFQQRAYALKDPTVEDLNRLYGQVAKDYGFDRMFGYEGREWTEIGHTFLFPFYYVSYGVSMLGAMSLAQRGGRAYGRVVRRRAGASLEDALGLDVLSEDVIRSLAAWVETTADGWLEP